MNKEKKQNRYEGMYVISATLSEEARKKAMEKVHLGITGRGGAILKAHDWGRRRLAYEIDGHREGYYFLLYFDLQPSAITELWQEYHLNEDLIRFDTFRTENVMEKIEFKSLEEQQ
jgi:small subunit ribosomal protein S6